MNWFAITLLAYFLLAVEIIIDKFLLSSKRVSHPAIYAFYVGALGLFAAVFAPFGFHAIGFFEIIPRILAGFVFIYGMLALFFAISKSEASRVTPVVGAVVPIVAFFLAILFLGERLGGKELSGLAVLVLGGLYISYDFSLDRQKRLFSGFYWSLAAGALLAVSAVLFKKFYGQDNFFNVYIWTRIGAFFGVLSFLIIPSWRKIIIASLLKFKKPDDQSQTSGLLFVLTRVTGGVGSLLKEKATSLVSASVTLVSALVSSEYVFIYILGIIFSLWLPNIFEEKKDWKTTVQKILAIFIITLGMILVSRKK